MLKGILANGTVVLANDGMEVVDVPEPPHMDGYDLESKWEEIDGRIYRVHSYVPAEGTAEEAALRLSRLQFQSLPDEAAYEFRALAEDYVDGMTCYGEGSGAQVTRVRYLGELYKFIGRGVQVMQPGWNPVSAPSLWARILPGQEGSGDDGPQPWEQPGSTNGYQKGDQATHNGHLWESTFDGDNVWEPGAVGAPWEDKGEYPGEESR